MTTPTAGIRTHTVLIADDNPNVRLLVSATIACDQYTLLTAADGDAAWHLVLQHRPAVAVLDVRMDGLSGLQVTRAIKSTPELAGTRVVLLTSRAQATDISAGLAAGADYYLTKPFSPRDLLTVLEQALTER